MPSSYSPQLEQHNPADLRPNLYNPNRMTSAQFRTLKDAMSEDGFLGVVLANRTSSGLVIIDGEHRWRGAVELGFAQIPCMVIEIPEERAKALSIKLNQIHGYWDVSELLTLLGDLPDPLESLGFSEGEREGLERTLRDGEGGKLLEDFRSQMGQSASQIRSRAEDRYFGFVLSPAQMSLLFRAIELVVKKEASPTMSRSAALEIILRAYLRIHDTTMAGVKIPSEREA